MSKKPTSAFVRASLALALGMALAACSPSDTSDRSASPKDQSSDVQDSTAVNANGIEESARKLFGGASPQDVRESAIKGLMQVKVNGNVFYSSPDGRYFMQGDMIEVSTMQSLTESARTEGRPELIAAIDPEAQGAITYKAKDEKYEVYVFTDVTCPYCTRFHEDMAAYNKAGITVHYFAWPRSGPGTEAATSMSNAWCAKNQKKALDDLFKHKSIRDAECDSPIEAHFELGRSLMVSGTPAVFSPDGRQHGGYMAPADLLRSLEGQAPAQ